MLNNCTKLLFQNQWRVQLNGHSSKYSSDAWVADNSYIWRKPEGKYTGISVYNHSLRSKVPLVLNNSSCATWYTCGPTVYDSAHLGHASTYVKVDIIQRILRDYFKINLVTAMNITDVDDKIIKRSKESGRDWMELACSYEAQFMQDMARLNVKPPDIHSRVSNNITIIMKFIEALISAEQAYVASDSSVYFNVSKYPHYGKLQKLHMSAEEQQSLLTDKNNAADFALWKARKSEHEPSWNPSWGGVGRPGWHIECSAIASQLFGSCVDFHAGGLDLRFPHHENEEAQCCAHHNTDQWVNYWLHTGQLHVKGSKHKMSKSLRNTISVAEMLRDYTADEFRMACLLSNYRNAMPYSDQLMQTARNTLQKFKNFYADLNAYTQLRKPVKLLDEGALRAQLEHTITEFDESLRDDFDTGRAISVLMDQMSSINRCINDQQVDADHEPAQCIDLLLGARNFICSAMQSFGIQQLDVTQLPLEHVEEAPAAHRLDVNALVDGVLDLRGKLREQAVNVECNDKQLLRVCDEMRCMLQQHGIQVRDHKQGCSWVFEGKSTDGHSSDIK